MRSEPSHVAPWAAWAGHAALAASLGCGGLALAAGFLHPAAGAVCLVLAVLWWVVGAACLDAVDDQPSAFRRRA